MSDGLGRAMQIYARVDRIRKYLGLVINAEHVKWLRPGDTISVTTKDGDEFELLLMRVNGLEQDSYEFKPRPALSEDP